MPRRRRRAIQSRNNGFQGGRPLKRQKFNPTQLDMIKELKYSIKMANGKQRNTVGENIMIINFIWPELIEGNGFISLNEAINT